MKPSMPFAAEAPALRLRVRAERPDQFTAELVGLPEVRATATTREEALVKLRRVVAEWLASA